jgi:hypothetical protein
VKAELDKHGCLVITPESTTESYAMQHWCSVNMIQVRDIARAENWYLRGTSILIQGVQPQKEGE